MLAPRLHLRKEMATILFSGPSHGVPPAALGGLRHNAVVDSEGQTVLGLQ